MTFYDLATNFELISEETTMGNIAYLPTSVGIIKSAVADLKRKKADWGIEILEDESGRTVNFENVLKIKIPSEHWNHFQQNFGRDLGLTEKRKLNEKIKDLSAKELRENVEEDMKKLRHDLKISLNKLFKKFVNLDDVIDNWLALFNTSSYVTSDKIMVKKEHKEKDIQRIYGELLRVYGDDKGNLELLISDINEERSLNSFDVFKDYENLYGCRIKSKLESGDTLILESTVDFAYHTIQTINFSNPDIGDAIEDESDEIKRVGSVLYSPTGLFNVKFFIFLNEIIDDLDTLESETEEK